MNNVSIVFDSYEILLNQLRILNRETENKVIQESPDVFICQNINFFTKSFMITLCAYLESFLKDITMVVVDDANEKLNSTKVA